MRYIMILTMPSETQVWIWILIGALSAWGGIVRYIVEIKEKKGKWRWGDLFLQIVVSCFSGFIGGLIGFESESSQYVTLIMAGVSGSLGSTAINIFMSRFLRK